jgi:hypothetical protein
MSWKGCGRKQSWPKLSIIWHFTGGKWGDLCHAWKLANWDGPNGLRLEYVCWPEVSIGWDFVPTAVKPGSNHDPCMTQKKRSTYTRLWWQHGLVGNWETLTYCLRTHAKDSEHSTKLVQGWELPVNPDMREFVHFAKRKKLDGYIERVLLNKVIKEFGRGSR